MASNCTAQNKPKRFQQPYFSESATRACASTFLSDMSGEEKAELGHRERVTHVNA